MKASPRKPVPNRKPVPRQSPKFPSDKRNPADAQKRPSKSARTLHRSKLSPHERKERQREYSRAYLRKYRKTNEYRAYARKYWSEWAKKNPERVAGYRKKHRVERARYNRLWWRGLVGSGRVER